MYALVLVIILAPACSDADNGVGFNARNKISSGVKNKVGSNSSYRVCFNTDVSAGAEKGMGSNTNISVSDDLEERVIYFGL